MTKFVEDSATRLNIMRAFEGEIFAKKQYVFFSAIAKREGLNSISELFLQISENKQNHAKIFYDFISKEDLEWVNYPSCSFSYISATSENLQFAKELEEECSGFLYPMFAKMAKDEGYKDIENTFELVVDAENEDKIKLREIELISALQQSKR